MILYALVFSLAAVVFNLTLPLMAGLYIVDALGGSTFMSSYGVSFFCLGNMLGVPLGRPGSTPLKPITLYTVCLGLMILFTWQCAVAEEYATFNFFRLLEGIASGPLYILISYTLIPHLAPDRDKAFINSLLLLCFSLGPVLAATWGGWISFYHNWRLLFVSHIIYCALLMTYVGYGYRKFHFPPPKFNLDWVGYIFYVVSVLCLGTALVMGQELDWLRSPLLQMLFFIGSVAFILLVWRCLVSSNPLIDFSLLRKFYFCLALINVLLLFAIYFGMIVLLSLWLRLYINYSPGWVILSIGITVLGAWIPILIHYKGYDPRIPLAVALICLMISSYHTTTFNVHINFERIAISRILSGIGLALFLSPLFRLSVQTYPRNRTAECLNFFHITRLIGSGVGMGLFVTLWHRRQVFYYERLGSRLNEFSATTQNFLQQAQHALPGKKAYAKLSYFISRQATALALEDCFYLMSWMLLILLVLVIFSFFIEAPKLMDKKEFPNEPELKLNRIH